MGLDKRLREHAEKLYRAGLVAVDPKEAVRAHFKREGTQLRFGNKAFDLNRFERILAVGAGKASAPMAVAVEEILGDRITAGIVNVKYGYTDEVKKIRLVEAGHPVPDEKGMEGARLMVDLVSGATEKDLVICLISGGGSALMPLPVEGISLQQKQEVTKLLLACGATINEMNALRKHISRVKGGQLARLAAPATLLSLILSDVVGDPLDVIASGMTVPDTSTFEEVHGIFQKFGILEKVPKSILAHIESGRRGTIAETPKEGDPIFARVLNLVIGSNMLALQAIEKAATSLGYRPLIFSSFIEGEAREVAKVLIGLAKEVRKTQHPIGAPACLIFGGESTVTIRGKGMGGRNQEIALSAALCMEGMRDALFLSLGTDGSDGPTDAAGALADGGTVGRAQELGMKALEYLQENNSYHFFDKLGDLIKTGPTNTNVNDIQIVLVAQEAQGDQGDQKERRPNLEKREIKINIGGIEAYARLNDSETAQAIWEALPFESQGSTWGDEIYFSIPVKAKAENPKSVVEAGDIAYWPPGSAFCIFWGPTPASHGDEIRPASAVNVFGKLTGDPKVFDGVRSLRVRVERA
jgi:hydroxypyruvate reductase